MSRKPNVLVVLIDDIGFRDLACCGSSFYDTPNIDCLSADGALQMEQKNKWCISGRRYLPKESMDELQRKEVMKMA